MNELIDVPMATINGIIDWLFGRDGPIKGFSDTPESSTGTPIDRLFGYASTADGQYVFIYLSIGFSDTPSPFVAITNYFSKAIRMCLGRLGTFS